MKEVNLFESYIKSPGKGVKLSRSVRLVTVVCLTAYCVAVAGVLSYWLLLKQQGRSIDKKIESQRQQIAELKETESLHLLIKERLKVLTAEELQSRRDLSLTVTNFEKVLPSGINWGSFGIQEDGKVAMSMEVPDAVVFNEFLDRVKALGKAQKNGWVEISNTNRTVTGEYSFSVNSNVQ